MAGNRLSQITALTSNTASDDLLMVVDKSDTTSSPEGTSKQIKAQYVIQTDTLSLTSPQVNILHTAPQTLVATPGAGFFIQPLTITCIATYVGIDQTASAYLYISNDASQTANYLARQRDFFKNETADRTYCFSASTTAPADGTFDGSIENKGLFLYSNIAFTGDWTMKVYTTYQICTI
tara:strand:+ start:4717 stop:5253 length:537 start_codon:yes stop_codon:yes gene_type:complete